jgi:pimeloyl-ACP methyl ester carboxylesterase
MRAFKEAFMFISVGDAKIFSTRFGPTQGPALLAIGGWIGSWELWALPLASLSKRWNTIAYDHRGTGATAAPVSSITLETLVSDVFAVLTAHGIGQCVLAAESAGALTALRAAALHPERITGLVIVDGMYHRDVAQSDPFLQGLQQNYAATLDRFIALCLPEPGGDHVRRWGRQIIDRASQEAAIALRQVNSGPDIRSELHQVQQPTLIIHSEGDQIVPVDQAHALAKMLPNSKLVILEGSSHVPTMTRPAAVAAEVEQYFGKYFES